MKTQTTMTRARWAGLALLVAGMAACWSAASALDVADVQNLIRNNVSEEVIINMVKSDGTIYITPEQADVLRSMGASENLVQVMRPTPTTVPSGAAYYSPSGSDLEDDEESGTPVVTGSPSASIPVASAPSASAPVIAESGSAMPSGGSPITPVAIVSSSAYPARYDKEGWVSISNHDWVPYYLNIDLGDKRMFLSKVPNGGVQIGSGQNMILNIRKEGYKMYGDSGNDLRVKVRENETTYVSLNPFGVFGNSGLTGVSTDRDNVRSEVLFNNYTPAPTVVVQEPSVIVQQPPVIVVPGPRPPVYYRSYPYYRPYRYRGGNSFYFGFSDW